VGKMIFLYKVEFVDKISSDIAHPFDIAGICI